MRQATLEDILTAYARHPHRDAEVIPYDAVRIRAAMKRRVPVARLLEIADVLRSGYKLRVRLNGENDCEIFDSDAEHVMTLPGSRYH